MTKKRYPSEYKEAVLQMLQPPENKTVNEICKQESLKKSTLYSWITKARKGGAMIPNSSPINEIKWRSEDKFRIVMETFSLNEEELGQYCRRHGLYASDVKRWCQILETALDSHKSNAELEVELKAEKAAKKELEKQLNYKEKALAETAALLVLRKKANAIWGDPEEE